MSLAIWPDAAVSVDVCRYKVLVLSNDHYLIIIIIIIIKQENDYSDVRQL